MNRRFVVIALICLSAPVASTATAQSATAPAPEAPVVVHYFHRTLRCQTCLTIESLARYDVLEGLVAEVESGQLDWRPVNFEEPENAGFVEAFSLVGPTLIVSRRAEGRIVAWERLDKVWELYDDVDAFDAYVLEAVGRFLDAASATGN